MCPTLNLVEEYKKELLNNTYYDVLLGHIIAVQDHLRDLLKPVTWKKITWF